MQHVPQAAGVYITEHYIDCIIGNIVNADLKSPQHIVPNTANRVQDRFKRTNQDPVLFLEQCAQWLVDNSKNLQSVVIGCFGPYVNLNYNTVPPTGSKEYYDYGVLTRNHVYEDWHGVHVYHTFVKILAGLAHKPLIRVYTDVDVAAYGEYWLRVTQDKSGNTAKQLNDTILAYLQVSRSINGGFVHNGDVWKGRLHPMMGVLRPQRANIHDGKKWIQDPFAGSCKFHDDCLEGLIGVDALEARTGKKFKEIGPDDNIWELAAFYIASLCVAVTGILAPSQIVLGGRIMKEHNLVQARKMLEMVRHYYYEKISDVTLGASPHYPELQNRNSFIQIPSRPNKERGARAGRHGALRLAVKHFLNKNSSKNGG